MGEGFEKSFVPLYVGRERVKHCQNHPYTVNEWPLIVQGKSRWELPRSMKDLTEKYHSWKAGKTLNSGRNWLGIMFEALLHMAQRPGH